MSKESRHRSSLSSIFFIFFFLGLLWCTSVLAVGEESSASPSPSASGGRTTAAGSRAARAPASDPPPSRRRSPPSSSSSPPASPTRRQGSSSIMAVLKEKPQYSTLVSWITKANLTVSLETMSPLTVFAPKNDGFELTLLSHEVRYLSDPKNIDVLRRLLFYHVVKGRYLGASLTDGMTLKTLEGENVTIYLEAGRKSVQFVDIEKADITVTEDGVVHGIAEVLVPMSVAEILDKLIDDSAEPSAEAWELAAEPSWSSDAVEEWFMPSSETVPDYDTPPEDAVLPLSLEGSAPSFSLASEIVAELLKNPNYTVLARVLESSGPTGAQLLNMLTNDTVFAPSNEAILTSTQVSELLLDPVSREDILMYHVLRGRYEFDWLRQHPGEYVEGFSVFVDGGSNVFVGHAASKGQIVAPGLYSNPNVIVHGINKVLVPPELVNSTATMGSASSPLSSSGSLEEASPSSEASMVEMGWVANGSAESAFPSSMGMTVLGQAVVSAAASSEPAIDGALGGGGIGTAGLVAALGRESNYSRLAVLIRKFGLTRLGDLKNNTLFAPTNSAISQFTAMHGTFLTDTIMQQAVLDFHILNGSYSFEYLMRNPGNYTSNFSVFVSGKSLQVGHVSALGLVIAPDLYSTMTMTIHGVDRVLLPPEYAGSSASATTNSTGTVAAGGLPSSVATQREAGASTTTKGAQTFRSDSVTASAEMHRQSLAVLLMGILNYFLVFFLM